MANIKDLQEFGEILKDDLPGLFKDASKKIERGRTQRENQAVAKLRKLVKASNKKTTADLLDRVLAVRAVLQALREAEKQYQLNSVSTTETRFKRLRDSIIDTRDALGYIAESEFLTQINSLLSDKDIQRFSAKIDKADEAVQKRKLAKTVLDTTVNLLILAAKLAVKLAV